MTECSAVVSHAGMGTILTALELGKPILVAPRLGRLAETRNDHQTATAQRFVAEGLVRAAYDDAELERELDRLASLPPAPSDARITSRASESLLARVRE
jgi:UDP-N-acetylglucosamine transferase subunit ALG13